MTLLGVPAQLAADTLAREGEAAGPGWRGFRSWLASCARDGVCG